MGMAEPRGRSPLSTPAAFHVDFADTALLHLCTDAYKRKSHEPFELQAISQYCARLLSLCWRWPGASIEDFLGLTFIETQNVQAYFAKAE
jgi:hypothetical protein